MKNEASLPLKERLSERDSERVSFGRAFLFERKGLAEEVSFNGRFAEI